MKKWYIKERHNPQLGVYYVPMGQRTNTEAKKYEKAGYGDNYMLPFESQYEYDMKIQELKTQGAKVQPEQLN
jgi:hypothetical protein